MRQVTIEEALNGWVVLVGYPDQEPIKQVFLLWEDVLRELGRFLDQPVWTPLDGAGHGKRLS
jgi:hypothetical protein